MRNLLIILCRTNYFIDGIVIIVESFHTVDSRRIDGIGTREIALTRDIHHIITIRQFELDHLTILPVSNTWVKVYYFD